ncbi:MAG: hypothetical protein GYA51_08275, partial [Candidatus Methanofastidiosa archaeon]|nr:hypothetical protein [Candidatus Methanofastidiosa archaeon]
FLLVKTGIKFNNLYDTMVAESLITKGIGKNFSSLGELTEKYCGVTLDKSVREGFFKNGKLSELTEEQLIYSALDVQYLEIIKNKQIDLLKSQKKVLDIEMLLLPAVIYMEYKGVDVDQDKWKILSEYHSEKAERLYSELIEEIISAVLSTMKLTMTDVNNCFELAKKLNIPVKTKKETARLQELSSDEEYSTFIRDNFNLNSPLQLKTVLGLLGIEELESTNAKDMKQLRDKYPFLNKIISYRENKKRITAFGMDFLKNINPIDGRIHATFDQIATNSGRFSSSNPNLQQIPSPSSDEKELGIDYRKCFIPPVGYKMITSDYSQQELRLAGAISQEPNFINAYKNDEDLHTLTATIIFSKSAEEISPEERKIAKSFNFAILYGSTEYGLAYNFNKDPKEMREMIDKYYAGYPKLALCKETIENLSVKNKFSVTLTGRRRYFEDKKIFTDAKEYDQYISGIKRVSFNHMIQGSGADIVKLSLARIYHENPFGEDMYICLTVHDEIVCVAKDEIVEQAKEFISKIMLDVEQDFLGEIPAAIGIEIGDYWHH